MPYTHWIPNHLETEDKFILNFSMRQCVILFVALCMAYLVFNDLFNAIPAPGLALGLGLAGALLVGLSGVALALIRVHKRGLDEWAFVLLMYAVAPKIYTWHFNQPDTFELSDLSASAHVERKRNQKEEENEW
ncbi:MAG: PrgI family mobile element protein [Ktedonobacteraceae bacterium]